MTTTTLIALVAVAVVLLVKQEIDKKLLRDKIGEVETGLHIRHSQLKHYFMNDIEKLESHLGIEYKTEVKNGYVKVKK